MTTSLIALISGAVGAVIAIAGAYLKGRRDAADKAAQRAAQLYKDGRERMDAEDYIDDDIGVIRERMSERGKR